jgi:hypothetical protein
MGEKRSDFRAFNRGKVSISTFRSTQIKFQFSHSQNDLSAPSKLRAVEPSHHPPGSRVMKLTGMQDKMQAMIAGLADLALQPRQ